MPTKDSNTQRFEVVIGDDHHVVRDGIRREVNRHPRLDVVGEAVDGEQTIAVVLEKQPDVLILDISMPKLNGVEVLKHLTRLQAQGERNFRLPNTLVLSAYAEPQYVYELFAAGAKGYLLKDEMPSTIVRGVFQVMNDEPTLSPDIQIILRDMRHVRHDELSERERQVLVLLARGYTDAELSIALRIATSTVRNHINNIYSKLPTVGSRAEAVAYAWENHYVSRR